MDDAMRTDQVIYIRPLALASVARPAASAVPFQLSVNRRMAKQPLHNESPDGAGWEPKNFVQSASDRQSGR